MYIPRLCFSANNEQKQNHSLLKGQFRVSVAEPVRFHIENLGWLQIYFFKILNFQAYKVKQFY